MGRGLSKLQRDILHVLDQYPLVTATTETLSGTARPTDIIKALGRKPTNANRATVSIALNRLYKRGFVETFYAERCGIGNGASYAKCAVPRGEVYHGPVSTKSPRGTLPLSPRRRKKPKTVVDLS